MLRLGVIAVLLLTVFTVLLGASRSSAHATVEHSCGLTDREFLQISSFQIESVAVSGDDYLHGNTKAKDLIEVSHEAARAVRETAPFDTSLQTVRRYLPGMFLRYADAVRLREAGKDSAPDMYRAYAIGARVKDVLREAKPALTAAGCDVSGLL